MSRGRRPAATHLTRVSNEAVEDARLTRLHARAVLLALRGAVTREARLQRDVRCLQRKRVCHTSALHIGCA